MPALTDQFKNHELVVDALTRCNFAPVGTPITCAVSGGADSMALLVLAVASGCAVTAVHVDHGLRPESGHEAIIVRDLAQQLGAGFAAKTVHVEAGSNLEARARDARYAVLPPDVVTGHTADDQAETVLINLLRGAGLRGLSGMQPNSQHPILKLRRSETHKLCDALKIKIVHDASNDDQKFQRNRIRRDLIPLLDELSKRDVTALLARQADVLRDDAELLEQLASHLDPTDAVALTNSPLALARRAIRAWIATEHPPDAATVERVLSVARGEVTACDIGLGRQVRRSQQRLRIEP